jgi:hypothetical protein
MDYSLVSEPVYEDRSYALCSSESITLRLERVSQSVEFPADRAFSLNKPAEISWLKNCGFLDKPTG